MLDNHSRTFKISYTSSKLQYCILYCGNCSEETWRGIRTQHSKTLQKSLEMSSKVLNLVSILPVLRELASPKKLLKIIPKFFAHSCLPVDYFVFIPQPQEYNCEHHSYAHFSSPETSTLILHQMVMVFTLMVNTHSGTQETTLFSNNTKKSRNNINFLDKLLFCDKPK